MNQAAKRTIKVVAVVILSVTGMALLAAALTFWVVLTPAKLSYLVNKITQTYVPGGLSVGKIELTLVKTFPEIGLEIRNIAVISPFPGARSDTLVSVKKGIVTINAKAFLKDKKILIHRAAVYGADAALFYNARGESNMDLFFSSLSASEQADNFDVSVDLKEFEVEDVNISYIDRLLGTEAYVTGFGLSLEGSIESDQILGKGEINIKQIDAVISDTTETTISVSNLSVTAGGTIKEELINGNIKISAALAELAMEDIAARFSGLGIDINVSGNTQLESGNGTVSLRSEQVQLNMDGLLTAALNNLGLNIKATGDIKNDSIKGTAYVNAANLTINLNSVNPNGSSNRTALSLGSIDLDIDGLVNPDAINGHCQIGLNGERLKINMAAQDMNGQDMNVSADAGKIHFGFSGDKTNQTVRITPIFNSPSLKLTMNGERYFDRWPVYFSLPVQTDTAFADFTLTDGFFSVNKQEVSISADCRVSNSDNIAFRANMSAISIHIEQIIAMIPENLKHMIEGIEASGVLSLNASAHGEMVSGKMKVNEASADISVKELIANYNETLTAISSNIKAAVEYPSKNSTRQKADLLDASLSASDLRVEIVDESLISAYFEDLYALAQISDFPDSTFNLSASGRVRARLIEASMDTLSATLRNSDLNVSMLPAIESKNKARFSLDFSCDSIETLLGSYLEAKTGKTSVQATAALDSSKDDFLLKWNPSVKIDLRNGSLNMLQVPVTLPRLLFNFSLGRFNIADSRLLIGNSDISLSGNIYNIDTYLEKTGLLTGEMKFDSRYTDMTELLSIINGKNRPTTQTLEDSIESTNPFMVPLGVNFTLNTNISVMEFNSHQFHNVGGDITIKDGVVVLQELGFSSNTAQMQLTAIYKTPSHDNLYAGLDFHLLDIEIDELISLIPSVDSIVPMLKSFNGKAQFHLAAETYMKANYEPKMPTLIGAAAIEAKNLVIMDNEVFNTIRKTLLMSRKAENKIDSLSVEMQVLRNKVDLYPFLIHMDKYKAVIGGRHNINKNLDCKYHISLIDSPLPIRLGVNIEGSLNDIANRPLKHIGLARCQYGTMYQPLKNNVTDQRTLMMKQSISDTLKENVK